MLETKVINSKQHGLEFTRTDLAFNTVFVEKGIVYVKERGAYLLQKSLFIVYLKALLISITK
jgi:hypothetical protein